MRFVNPPAKNSKEEPNVYKISNRALHPDAEEATVFNIPAEQFIYPQVDGLDEAKEICGGEAELVDVFNGFLRDASLGESKNKIRLASSGTHHDIIAAGISAGKNFTFIQEQRLSAGEVKEKFSALRDLAQKNELSDAEMVAQMKAMLGIA